MTDPDPARSPALPSASGGITRLACTRAAAAGIELTPLLKRAGLTIEQIDDPDVRLTVQSQIRFLDLAADALHDPLLGFHLARDFELREVGLLYYVLASSDMLDDALQRAARYSTTVNEGVSLRYREANDIRVVLEYVGVARHSDRHQIEFFMTTLVRCSRQLSGLHLLPHSVKLTHRREEDYAPLNAFFGCDVEFGADVDEVAFDRAAKDMRLIGADPYLNELLTRYCEEALAQRAGHGRTMRSDVENAIAPLLPHGKARVGEVARRLGMSQRTLARRLASEGLTFGGVFDQLRADLARRHIREPRLSISQIAWLLGYQEASAFSHAFKRWTGRTPREMRSQESGATP